MVAQRGHAPKYGPSCGSRDLSRRRNAERPGSLPAFVVCCELYSPDYFAMQVAQKLLNSAISASLSWPCISVSRSLSAMSAWVNSCVATFP